MLAIGGFTAPAFAQGDKGGAVKVVYHLSDGNAQATNAIRNIRNHLTADPAAKIVVVTHAAGIQFLLDGALDGNGAPFEAAVQELKGKGVDFRVCRFTLERNKIDPARSFRKRRWFLPASPRCPGCNSRKDSPICVPERPENEVSWSARRPVALH